jgi:hypothetical protein
MRNNNPFPTSTDGDKDDDQLFALHNVAYADELYDELFGNVPENTDGDKDRDHDSIWQDTDMEAYYEQAERGEKFRLDDQRAILDTIKKRLGRGNGGDSQ